MNTNNNKAKAAKKINKATIAKAKMSEQWRQDQLSFNALCEWAMTKGRDVTSEWLKESKANGKKNVPTLSKCANKKNLAAMLRVLDARKIESFVPTEENPQPRLWMTMKDGSMRRRFTTYPLQVAVNNWDQDAIDALLDQERKAKERKAKKAA